MQERFISPLNDIVFKTLWFRADEDLKLYLNRIIEYATKKDISKYHISANETGIVNLDNIANKVDILLVSDDGKIDIELNNTKDNQGYTPIETVFNKSLIYLSFYITTYYDKDKKNKYKKQINVEQVNLNAFHCPHNYMIEKLDFELCDPLHNISKEGIICHHIYLPRMEDICYTKDDNIYKDYAILLCESYEEMENLAGSDSGRCALIKMLKSLGRDDKFMTVIDKYEYEKILHIEEGIGQTKREMVISMKENGIEVEKIAKIANITIEEVNKILEEEKNNNLLYINGPFSSKIRHT